MLNQQKSPGEVGRRGRMSRTGGGGRGEHFGGTRARWEGTHAAPDQPDPPRSMDPPTMTACTHSSLYYGSHCVILTAEQHVLQH